MQYITKIFLTLPEEMYINYVNMDISSLLFIQFWLRDTNCRPENIPILIIQTVSGVCFVGTGATLHDSQSSGKR